MLRSRLLRGLIPLALAVGFSGLASPQAKATLNVTVKIDGTTVDTFSGANTATNGGGATYTVGGTTFTDILINATANTPGTPTVGTLAQTSVTATGSTGTGILEVDVVNDAAYTLPGSTGTPMTLQSNVSRADGVMGNPLTFNAFAGTASGLGDLANPGVQTQDQSLSPIVSPNQVSVGFIRPATYYLSSVLTLAAGVDGNQNVNGSIRVTAVPEPGTLAMVAFGLPMLGLGAWRRRRNATKA